MRLLNDELKKIKAGTKVTHRLPARRPHKLQAHDLVELTVHGSDAVRAQIVVTGIKRQELCRVTDEDAQAEGFASREEFLDDWRSRHGIQDEALDAAWVVWFRVTMAHRPRLVHKVTGYTSAPHRALVGEPEAVPGGYEVPSAAAVRLPAAEANELQQLADSLKVQLKEMGKAAKKSGADIGGDLVQMRHRVKSIEAKIRAGSRAA